MRDAIVNTESFQSLELPRKEFHDLYNSEYHVYTDRATFVKVEACHAQEAIVRSGILNPWRVQRYDIMKNNILSIPQMMGQDDAPRSALLPVAEPAPAAATVGAEEAAAQSDAGEAAPGADEDAAPVDSDGEAPASDAS